MNTARKMTPEVRAKLIGFAPVSASKGVPFTPDIYKDDDLEEFAPTFYQRGWTEDEKNRLMSKAANKKEDFDTKLMRDMARVTILDMEGLMDIGSMEPVAYIKDNETGGLSKDVFNNFPFALQMSLFYNAQKISGMGGLSDEETESLK